MCWNNLSDRWKDYFINILHTTARMSKDENTKVGSLIVDTDRKVVVSSSGMIYQEVFCIHKNVTQDLLNTYTHYMLNKGV